MRGTRRRTGNAGNGPGFTDASGAGESHRVGGSAARRLAAGAAAALLLLSTGCILRPEDPDARRNAFDRSGLSDVLLSEVPPRLEDGGAVFADGIELAGWRMTPEKPRPGDTVEVDLFWRAVDRPLADWTVFVHLDPPGDDGRRINADHPPVGGRYPTGVWEEGDVVRDSFSFHVPRTHPANVLEFWVGLFRGDERLEVVNRRRVRTDGKDRVLAGTIPLG